MEVFLSLLEEAKHEEDFVVHEEWGEDERCSESIIESRPCTINAGKKTYLQASYQTTPGRGPRVHRVRRIERSNK